MALKLKIGDKLKLSAAGVKSWSDYYPNQSREIFSRRRYTVTDFHPAHKWPLVELSAISLGDILGLGYNAWMLSAEEKNYELADQQPKSHNHPLTHLFV